MLIAWVQRWPFKPSEIPNLFLFTVFEGVCLFVLCVCVCVCVCVLKNSSLTVNSPLSTTTTPLSFIVKFLERIVYIQYLYISLFSVPCFSSLHPLAFCPTSEIILQGLPCYLLLHNRPHEIIMAYSRDSSPLLSVLSISAIGLNWVVLL